MAPSLQIEANRMEYIVRYDVDGNGWVDDVFFGTEEYARSYESCYIDNDLRACSNDINPIRIQFFTAGGSPAKLCNMNYWSPLAEFKSNIKRLADNSAAISDLSLRVMAEDLYDVIRKRPDDNKMLEALAKHINILNDVSNVGKMNNRQVELLARILVDHVGDIMSVIKRAVDIFNGNINIRKLLKDLSIVRFEKRVNGHDNASLNGRVDLSESELQEIVRAFPGNSLRPCLSQVPNTGPNYL